MSVFLFLSGGSLVGQNLLFVFNQKLMDAKKICFTSDAEAASLSTFDEVYLVPETKGNFSLLEECLLEVLAENEIKMVFPCRDDDVAFLAYFKKRHPSYESILPVGDSWIANSFLDKLVCSEMADKAGLPYAPVSSLCAADVESFLNDHDFPVVVKPKEGFASKGVSIVSDIKGLKPYLGSDEFVLQKFIGSDQKIKSLSENLFKGIYPLFYSLEPPKLSFQSFINIAGEFTDVFVTENIMKSGVSTSVRRIECEKFRYLGLRWVESMARIGWRGPINLQCAIDENGEPWIYEFNGRHTGATSARYALGCDEVQAAMNFLGAGSNIQHGASLEAVDCVNRVPVSAWGSSVVANSLLKAGVWKKKEVVDV